MHPDPVVHQNNLRIERQRIMLVAILIIIVGIVSYRESFRVPFIFDDIPTIQENPTILHIWPLKEALFPPPNSGLTTAGRPLVNLSLAVNYALDQYKVTGYHIFNLGAHLCAALALTGIARRTFLQPSLQDKFGQAALPLASVIALLWLVHPLNTAAVTYIVQRAEVMTCLFYLLALYSFIRGSAQENATRWLVFSVAACYFSVASKEVGATIPLTILLYDRTFCSGSFRKAWALRWKYYLSLVASWCFQILLILSTGNRGGTAGFGVKMPLLDYALTQTWAIANYLKLIFWPSPLIFDYGTDLITTPSEVILPCILIVLLLGLTLIALWKRPILGFLGAGFFVILAPSSSVVPVVTQTMAEHRMYLPSAVILALVVTGLYSKLGKSSGILFAGLIVMASMLTQFRIQDYKTHLSIWRDTVEKRPQNARAWKCLGVLVAQLGDYPVAIKMYDHAKQIEPRDPGLYFNTANALGKIGRIPDAIREYQIAIQMLPSFAEARNNLANIYLQAGQADEAVSQLQIALKIDPNSAQAHYNMGRGLQMLGKTREAEMHLLESLRIRPDFPPAMDALQSLRAATTSQ
ncbi:MAG: tetratricopeptide repeat protein [Chthoniobacterales bacterium]